VLSGWAAHAIRLWREKCQEASHGIAQLLATSRVGWFERVHAFPFVDMVHIGNGNAREAMGIHRRLAGGLGWDSVKCATPHGAREIVPQHLQLIPVRHHFTPRALLAVSVFER
jgi:hypothetical protein